MPIINCTHKAMLDKIKHKSVYIEVLKRIYNDTEIAPFLGFKGGTAAYLFYDLPRFSVDLDFDLLDTTKKVKVFERVAKILQDFGEIVEKSDKHYTLFFIVRYEKEARLLKVEISKRPHRGRYETLSYFGMPMVVATKETLLAGKLNAVTSRANFAARDLLDLWFFLKNNWNLDTDLVQQLTGLPAKDVLIKAATKIQSIEKNQLLQGIGELLNTEKQKIWVKEKLKEELLFYVRFYEGNI